MNRFEQEGPNDIYRGFQRVLIAQDRIDTALEVAEQGRSYAFRDLLVNRLSVEPKFQPASAQISIDEIKKLAITENSTLVQYSVIYDSNQFYWFYRSKLGFEQRYAQATTLYIWVVKPTGEVGFREVDLKQLWKQQAGTTSNGPVSLVGIVRSVRDSLNLLNAERRGSDLNQKLQQLYQLLIAPISDLLPTDLNQRVTFIPQDFLFLVPFCALQDSDGKYLIEKYIILTAPSIQALSLAQAHRQRLELSLTLDSLVVGNPTMPSYRLEFNELSVQLTGLPETEIEAKTIASLLETKPLIGAEATKLAVLEQLPYARIVHLATHTLLDDIESLRCAIAFTPSDTNDGFLRVPEIFKRYGKPGGSFLNAELVVLSSCNTGRDHLWGDGIAGLSLALIAAGVPTIIFSLWAIADSKVSLISEFYQNLENHSDKALALRQAMLTTMQQYPHPRDWAAFTLIGEAD